MPRRSLASFLLALALVAACAPKPSPRPADSRDAGRTARVPSEAATRAVASGVNAMGFDMYAQLRGSQGNLVFSPASIGFALGMVYGGAAGETARDMAKTMHFAGVDGLDGHADAVHEGFAGLRGRASELEDGGAKLRIANRIWAATGMAFARKFLALTKEQYDAEAENADFAREAEAVRKRINAWVAKTTNDRIKDLLPPSSVGADTVMVLVNAIWFKGTWAHKFDPEATVDGPFTRLDGNPVQVKMMQQFGPARFARLADVRLLELDYAGSDLSMVLVLGDSPGGFADLESKLTVENLATWTSRLHDEPQVDVALPRFEMKQNLDLAGLLEEIGLARLFGSEADLSAMLESGKKGLFVSGAFHQAFVSVNEEGAEAAAATAIVITESAAASQPPSFRADRPFVWMIRDKRTGLILFLGRVVDPS